MAVPRNRVSNARKNSRRAHHAKRPRTFASCSNCSAKTPGHTVCHSCGHYGGRAIVEKKEA